MNVPPMKPLWRDTLACALLLTATLKIMANATISPSLPGLEADFHGEPFAPYLTRFLVSAPSVAVVLLAPFAGLAADRYGRAPLLVTGIVLFILSGTAGAYLPTLTSILMSRLLLGVAVALTATAQVALVGDLFSGERRAAFMGWQTSVINFGGFVFIGCAGFLAVVSPRLPFLIYGVPVFLLLPLLPLLRQEREAKRSEQRTSVHVQATSKRKGWLVQALGLGAVTMLTVMLFFLMPSQLPFYLRDSGFDAAAATGWALGVLTFMGGVTALGFKLLSERVGLPKTLAIGFILMAAGFVVLGSLTAWYAVLAGAALIGAGYALVQPCFLFLALKIAPPSRRGTVSGVITTAIFLGQIISPILLTPIIFLFGFASTFLGVAGVVTCLSAGALAWLGMQSTHAAGSA